MSSAKIIIGFKNGKSETFETSHGDLEYLEKNIIRLATTGGSFIIEQSNGLDAINAAEINFIRFRKINTNE